MKATLYSKIKIAVILIIIFFPLSAFSQALLNADGITETYSLINSILAPGAVAEETPDAFDPSFGPHIKQVWDADLGKYCFEFYLHISNPNELQDESTGDVDRQRVEIKTYESSPDSLKGVPGETILYKWRFKIPVGFQPSTNFTHIHQIKAVNGDDSNPIFTLTPRYNSSGNKLELNYYDGQTPNVQSKFANVDLTPFYGNWVEATEKIYVDSLHGNYSISINRVSDGANLMSYANADLCTFRSTNSFTRPKWGIYRSILSISYLRDETMRFNGFSIQEIKNQAQTITFPALPAVAFGDDNFDPGATTTSGLNISYTSSNPAVATIVNDTINIIGAGTTIITAKQTGNQSFATAVNVSQTLTVTKGNQTIAFSAITKAVGDADFSPAIASSGLPVTYQSSNSAVATIVSGKIHILGAGTTTITSSQAGNANYNAATDNAQTLTVSASALYYYNPASVSILTGTLNSGTYANLVYNDASFYRVNSTTSGTTRSTDWYGSVFVSQPVASVAKLIVNYDGKNSANKTQVLYLYNFTTSSWTQIDSRTVSSSEITITNEQALPVNFISSGGEIRLRVTSSGSASFSTYGDWIQFTLQNITKSNQTITFNTLTDKTYGDSDFAPGATASSGLICSYVSSNPAVATIVNSQIHIVGLGVCNITASQAGDSFTNAANDVTQILTVSKLNQTITFNVIPTKSVGMADFNPGATASSGLTVTYTSSNTSVATIVNNQIHIVGSGNSTITASQIGDSNTNAATDVIQQLTVTTPSSVLMEETFNYAATNLANETSWTTAFTVPITNGTGRNIITGALTFSNSGGTYVLSGIGNTMNCDYTSGATDYKNYKSFTSTSVSSGAVYLSFLYKTGVSQSQTNSEVFGLATGTSAGAKIWAGKGIISTSNYRFGTTRGSTTSTDIKWGITEFSDVNAVFLIILKYDFTSSTSSIFLNPTVGSSTEPIAYTSDNTTATTRSSLNNLWFRLNLSNAAKYNISSIRVSTSWADAVASKGITTNIENSENKGFVFSAGKTIFVSQPGTIQVFNLQGSQVLLSTNTNLLTTNLPAGLYIVRFTGYTRQSSIQKIIIK